MKFVADCMLGKLAKWMKILGLDTAYFSKIEDDDLLSLARRESRILLTRDNLLAERAKDASVLFIESEKWDEQIRQVLSAFDLGESVEPYSRCLECNVKLKPLPKNRARNLVTPFIFANAQTFSLCPQCGRVFWKGTHQNDMEDKITKILGPAESSPSVKI